MVNNKGFFIIFYSVFVFLFILVFANSIAAQNFKDISYPIPELGNCSSRLECKIFCDDPANYVVCSEWAAKNNIISEEEVKAVEREVEQRKKFERGEILEGPGGCRTPEECDAYCQEPEHADECFRFGVEHNLISSEEAKRIKKEMEEAKGPGGCKTREECDAYCSVPEHMKECIEFGVKEGTLTPEESKEFLEIMTREKEARERMPGPEEFRQGPKKPELNKEKVNKVLKIKKGPGGCSTIEECKEYCSDVSHAEECLSFAEENGLASPEEIKEMREMSKVMMTEGGPGGCRGPKECDEYCAVPEHQNECLEFAKKHNLISPEEVEMIEKMGGFGGPGGCRSPKECDAYCRDPQHTEECLMFSVKQGTMSKEDAERMMEILKKQEERGKMLKGAPPSKGMGPEMPHMFEQGMPKQNEWPGPKKKERPGVEPYFSPPSGSFPQDKKPPKNFFQPPYKEERQMPPREEIEGWMPPEGAMPPSGQFQMGGPGGCMTPEECDAYCSKPEHQEECSKFSGGGQMPLEKQIPFEEYEQMPPEGQILPEKYEQIPPEGEPQSLLKRLENFLADIGILLNFYTFVK